MCSTSVLGLVSNAPQLTAPPPDCSAYNLSVPVLSSRPNNAICAANKVRDWTDTQHCVHGMRACMWLHCSSPFASLDLVDFTQAARAGKRPSLATDVIVTVPDGIGGVADVVITDVAMNRATAGWKCEWGLRMWVAPCWPVCERQALN